VFREIPVLPPIVWIRPAQPDRQLFPIVEFLPFLGLIAIATKIVFGSDACEALFRGKGITQVIAALATDKREGIGTLRRVLMDDVIPRTDDCLPQERRKCRAIHACPLPPS
jgi:hypothetical protein